MVPGIITAGKPKTLEEAHKMFDIFMNNTIIAISGVHLIHIPTGKVETFCEESKLIMKQIKKEEVEEIFKRVTPLDKAGGFSIKLSPEIFSKIEGSTSNIEGLPLETLKSYLKKFSE